MLLFIYFMFDSFLLCPLFPIECNTQVRKCEHIDSHVVQRIIKKFKIKIQQKGKTRRQTVKSRGVCLRLQKCPTSKTGTLQVDVTRSMPNGSSQT